MVCRNNNKSMSKKYIYTNFVFHLDNSCNINSTVIKELDISSKEKALESMKRVEDQYFKQYNDEKMTSEKKTKLLYGGTDPNKYKETIFVILEKEIMHLYSRKKMSHKNFPVKLNTPVQIQKIKKKIEIDVEINGLLDLIEMINKYPISDDIEYNINMESLHKVKPYLTRLQNMIGMKTLKKNIVDQILYFVQDFHIGGKGMSRGDYLHTVIYGPPGTGKTHVAKIIGKIFSKLGILKKGTFKKVTRSDLVAGYLGQTAIKTCEVIKEALDGVLFIDEAYALGNPEKKDSFSKECIDTLCESLSNYKENLMVIIAGYESELNECFFNYNKGLDSRFNWRFKIDNYDGYDLHKIFLKKVHDFDWTTDNSLKEEWFIKNMPYFAFYGRDMEVLFSKTKISHSRRVFCKSKEEKKVITIKDLERGFEMFMDNDEVKKRKESETHQIMMNTLYV